MSSDSPTKLLRLPSELVALIHHVELSEAGWRDDLLDRLILSSLFLQGDPCTPDELRTSLESDFGLSTDYNAFHQSVKRLLESRQLVEIDRNRLKLAEKTAAATEEAIVANQSLERRVASRFKEIISARAPQVDPEDSWRRFCDECLDPLVTELGARTYELIAAPLVGGPDIYGITSITEYIDSYTPDNRKGIKESIDRFLDSTDTDVRSFILSRIHSHLLTLSASLPEHSLAEISAKMRSTVQLKLFLDSNFLFSVLDLHENPANAVAHDLIRLLAEVKNHVQSKLYVFPLTLDEVTRTLSVFRQELSSVEVRPRLGRIARNISVGQGSGIRSRFLRAAANSTHNLNAHEYFSPFISNLLSILRSKGLEFFNERVEELSKSQPVLDDILAEQEFESRRLLGRRKTYEVLRHDVSLWHFVSKKRRVRIDSPLDAVYWVVTIDHNLLRFDRHKTRHGGVSQLPICVHPAVLIQMLQLWLPRTPQFDETMLQCVRALLPHPHETDVEQLTLRILRTLSRFEGSDNLPEEAVSAVLVNRAVRERMGEVAEPEEQDKVIRDALIEELAAAKETGTDEIEARVRSEVEARLREKERSRVALEGKLHATQTRAEELQKQADRGKATTADLKAKLQEAEQSQQKIGERLSQIEDESNARDAKLRQHEDFQKCLYRGIFLVIASLLLAVASAVAIPGTKLLDELIGSEGHRSLTIVILVLLGLWVFIVDLLGQKSRHIGTWEPFKRGLCSLVPKSLILRLTYGHLSTSMKSC